MDKNGIDRRSLVLAATVGVALAGCSGGKKEPGTVASSTSGGETLAGGQVMPKPPYRGVLPNAAPVPADPAAASNGGVVPSGPGYSLPLVSQPTTLKVATFDNYYAPRSYSTNLEVWAEFERRTGIKIAWEVAPPSQYATVMGPRLASGQNLPDICSLPTGNPVKAAEDGLIISLTPYINDQHTPNIMKFFKDFPDVRKAITAPDGQIYSVTSVVSDATYSDPMGFMIRQDWLDKLKLKAPTTLPEWSEVLKAFRTKDPNGNGSEDEVPLVSNIQMRALTMFGNALGLHLFYSFGWYVTDDHKVYCEWTDPRLMELLTWLNKAYTDKLFDPQFYQAKSDDVLRIVTRNQAGAAIDFTNRTTQYNKAQQAAGQSDAQWVMIPPPGGEMVPKPYIEGYGPNSGAFGITKACKDPQLAMRWLDYVWCSDEGNTLTTYGIEGLTYTVGPDKKLILNEWVTANPQKLDPGSALRYYGAFPSFPWIRASTGPLSGVAWDVVRLDKSQAASAARVAPYVTPTFPDVLATGEESAKLAKISTDLDTFRNESWLKFILGQQPINASTWKTYTSTLVDMGMTNVIAIKQAQYDRFRK